MPKSLENFDVQPGLYTIQTPRSSVQRWKDGDHVRFHKGLPEKMGGWLKADTDQFLGLCRKLFDWQGHDTSKHICISTNQRLYIFKQGVISNITPIDESGTLGTDPFTMVDTEADVTVADVAHTRNQGSYVTFAGASASNGITINGEYVVKSVTDADSYVITHSSAATSSGSGGGASVTYSYELNIGLASSVFGYGFGAGFWSRGGWGDARLTSTFLQRALVWSLDKWGENLLACPRGGKIYVWDLSTGVGTRAVVIAEAPITCSVMFTSPENQHLVALGAHTGVDPDPLLIRWCSSEDYTDWTASAINSAGQKRLDTGNEIIGYVKANKETMIFTDNWLWAMSFTGPPLHFAFNPIGHNGVIRGQNGMCEYDGIVFWMSEKDFYYYNGSVSIMNCDVWNKIFEDINDIQRIKTFCAVNRLFGEVWWFYCSSGASENDRYVVYNVSEKHWTYGSMSRTYYVGDSSLQAVPYAAGADGYIYNHETGVDDDTAAMDVRLESYDFEIGQGREKTHVTRMIPDFKRLTGSINLTLLAKEYPQSVETQTSEVINIVSSTEYINPHVSGRQVSMKFESSTIGDDFRMSVFRAEVGTHGRQ